MNGRQRKVAGSPKVLPPLFPSGFFMYRGGGTRGVGERQVVRSASRPRGNGLQASAFFFFLNTRNTFLTAFNVSKRKSATRDRDNSIASLWQNSWQQKHEMHLP